MVGLTLFSVVAIWMLVSIDGWFTLAVFGPTVVIVYIAACGSRAGSKRYREATREATGRVTEALGETFGAVQAIKVAGAEGSMIKHFRRLSDERRLSRSGTRCSSRCWSRCSGTRSMSVPGSSSWSPPARCGPVSSPSESLLFIYFLGFVADAVFFLGLPIARYQQATVSLPGHAGR